MKTTMSECELVAGLRNGEPEAFEELVHEHRDRMLAVAGRFFHCEQEREDAVQDAFISAFRAIDGFDEKCALSTWLHRITVNCCLMRLRSKRRRTDVSIDEMLPMFDETGHAKGNGMGWDDDGFGRLALSETREQVHSCIDQLPESYRTVLMLRDIDELDTEQTAQKLRTSVANVKTRLHRARAALRTLLEPVLAEA